MPTQDFKGTVNSVTPASAATGFTIAGGTTPKTLTVAGDTTLGQDKTVYNPTIASATGTITSYTATGRYIQIGNVIVYSFNIILTDNGTGATSIRVNVPATCGGLPAVGSGREYQLAGFAICADLLAGGTYLTLRKAADDSYPGATNYRINGSIVYML
ncbi:MAG: hypothetical protein ABII90_01735 [Bacteroidota bacterium]